MSAYPQSVLEYFRRPVLTGGVMLRGEAGSVEQGTWVCVSADVVAGRLENMGFRAFACPHIIAACNRAAEMLEGAPVQALQDLQLNKLQQEFEIPVEKAGKLLILKDAFANCYVADVGVA
jgi:NifU-like protein involved in Fe-S cluster formation